MQDPIDLYYWPTPNGWKASIALEEMGLPYRCHLIDIGAGDQHAPSFLAISPNNRIPAITDPAGPDGALAIAVRLSDRDGPGPDAKAVTDADDPVPSAGISGGPALGMQLARALMGLHDGELVLGDPASGLVAEGRFPPGTATRPSQPG